MKRRIAVSTQVGRFLTLNTKDFTTEVAAQSGLHIMTPGEFVQEIQRLVDGGL